MAEVQHKIEIVLKKKVHDHYQLFLYVNERISEVGNEVADVKRLIQHTQKLFNVSFQIIICVCPCAPNTDWLNRFLILDRIFDPLVLMLTKDFETTKTHQDSNSRLHLLVKIKRKVSKSMIFISP